MPLLFLAGFIFSTVFDRLLGRPVSALSFFLPKCDDWSLYHTRKGLNM